MEYSKEAQEIVKAIGGEENISKATHCVTRLRFALHDEDKVDVEALENMDIVRGTFSANGQYQVVIGQGTVDKVYAAMDNETGRGEATKEEVRVCPFRILSIAARSCKPVRSPDQRRQ